MTDRARVMVMGLLWCCLATPALAAGPARSLTELSVEPDMLLFVDTTAGSVVRGRFVRVSAGGLEMTVTDGRLVTLPAPEIRRIWRSGDRLRNGAVFGAVFGVLTAVLGQSRCSDCAGAVVATAAVGVPIYAGIGALIDNARVGRTLIYLAP